MIARDIIMTDKSDQSFLKKYLSIMYHGGKIEDLVLVSAHVVTSQMYMRDYLSVAKYASNPEMKIIILRNKEDSELMAESANYSGLMALSNVASHNAAELGSLMDTYKLMANPDKKDNNTARAIFNYWYKEQTMLYLKKELDKAQKSSSLEKWLNECRELSLEGTDEEITSSVKKWRPELNSEFKGKYLKGLFVNIFETMYEITWDVDMVLVEIMKKLEKTVTKDVIIIYDREKQWVRNKLQEAKVPWVAIPKSALKTATLEIVIDNIAKNEFESKFGITVKNYVNFCTCPEINKPDLLKIFSHYSQPLK